MRIIIVGAGEVGYHTAERLTFENKEVVVIDRRPEALKRFSEQLDVQTILGSGSSPTVLQEAGVRGADILLAVTDSDETNLVACVLCNVLAPGIVKLARIRSDEYSGVAGTPYKQALNISMVINPEIEVVKTIELLLSAPAAEDISEFADGRIKLVGTRVQENSPLAGLHLPDLPRITSKLKVVIAAIIRSERLIVPTGKDRIEAGDLVYWVCESRDLAKVARIFGNRKSSMRSVMIIGGGNIGARLAARLEQRKVHHVKLVENDPERCRLLAEQLNSSIILNGDGTDQKLLEEENIADMDVVISLTGDEETNIITSLLARRLNAKRTITRINKFAYMPLVTAVGLENIVSSRLSAVHSILQFIRRGKILSTVSLKGEQAEAMEALALKNSDIVGKPLKDLKFPAGSLVLALIRGDEVIIPTGQSVIDPQDRIIILSTRANIPRVEEALTVKLEYF